jgi:hypothetical protein
MKKMNKLQRCHKDLENLIELIDAVDADLKPWFEAERKAGRPFPFEKNLERVVIDLIHAADRLQTFINEVDWEYLRERKR